MPFLSALILILLIIFIRRTFRVVPNQAAFIKERLGKFSGVLGPGFHFLVPVIDRVAYRHTLKEQVADVAAQICITRDNVQVEVDGILYLRVLDPERASYGIQDYGFAAMQLAQTSMRSEIGKLDLDMTFKEREKINDAVVKAVDHASEHWGIKVTRYEIKNIVPPPSILNSMEQQMKAEREKRADILQSEGERAALINQSQGEKQEEINVSEGEKQKRINEAEGRAKEIELVADATAEALRTVAQSINAAGGREAVQLRIAQEFIRKFGEVVEQSRTTVVPLSVANIQGVFEGVSKTMAGIKKQD
ncbi:MAG: paraslipin [Leptospirales bacterium]|nr:paraslipin [Leptospirales bacterium]